MSKPPNHGPDFLGIGAQKAGTTWLYKMLSLHPDIGMPVEKELHFWDRQKLDAATIETYCHVFDQLPEKVLGEITPSYAILPTARIAVIHENFPCLRMLYILRNPIHRAWSQATMDLSKLFPAGVPSDFKIEEWLYEHFHSSESLARGNYASCLSNWFTQYSRQQVRVFIYEEEFNDPRGFLKSCCSHIGADPQFFEAIDDRLLSVPIYPETELLRIPRLSLPEPLQLKSASILASLYAENIKAVEQVLGRNLSNTWLHAYL